MMNEAEGSGPRSWRAGGAYWFSYLAISVVAVS